MIETENLPPVLPKGDYLKGIPQLTSFLGVSIPTARRIIKEEHLPFFKVGQTLYFEKEKIRKALQKGGRQ